MTKKEGPAAGERLWGDARSRAVWRWQLVLAISVVTMAALAALLTPTVFTDWRYLGGFLAVIVVTLIALAVRWEHVSSSTIIWMAIVDIFAIFLLSWGSAGPISFLWVFPIAWISTYYSTGIVIGALALISGLMMAQLAFSGFDVNQTISFILLLIALGFIATTTRTGAHRTASAKRLLRAQAQRIEATLNRVTEQRARTQQLLDSLDIGVARVSSEGLLQLANERFQELFSFEEASQFSLARAVEYRTRRGTPTPQAETIVMRAARGELFVNELTWLFDINGKWRALRATTRVMENNEFTGDGLLLIIDEVTDKVDPESGDGAAMRLISHELRNPLTAVLGHVDLLLEREDLPAAAREQAEIIERAGERMQTLIDQALSAALSSDKDADVEDIDFDLTETVRTSIEAFTPVAESNRLRLQTSLADTLVMSGDVFRIRQVIDNVLSNAIKYSERGGAVNVRGFYKDDKQVAIEVSDSGIGIAEADLPHVIEANFRAPNARASGVAGTGLGLSISSDIVVQSGGTLEVKSEVGKGTTVKIALPTGGKRHLS